MKYPKEGENAEENQTPKEGATKKDEANNTDDDVIPPSRLPTKTEEDKLFAKTIEIMSIAGMDNHVYKFANKLYKQKSGGPIGLALTGDIADCYLIQWDKKFIRKLKYLNINLIFYKRFKDDITIITEDLEHGSRFEDEKVIIDIEKKITDEKRSDEDITMEGIVDIAESVDNIIKFTYDVPRNHTNDKFPVLDVEVNINKNENNKIDYEFYEKPTNNKRIILEDAALPSKQKRTILTQECLRRLRNTKIELGEAIEIKHLNNFMLKMKNSGYPKSTELRS